MSVCVCVSVCACVCVRETKYYGNKKQSSSPEARTLQKNHGNCVCVCVCVRAFGWNVREALCAFSWSLSYVSLTDDPDTSHARPCHTDHLLLAVLPKYTSRVVSGPHV